MKPKKRKPFSYVFKSGFGKVKQKADRLLPKITIQEAE